MNPQDHRSGYVTRTGQIIGADELKWTRILLEALQAAGISVTMDAALKAFRQLPLDFKSSQPMATDDFEEDDEDDDEI